MNPQQDPATFTPLQCAVNSAQADVVGLLLGAKADQNCFTTSKGGTALQVACRKPEAELAESLIDAGADVDATLGCKYDSDKSEFDDSESDDWGSDDSLHDCAGITSCLSFRPPIIAAEYENWESVQILLEEGAAVNPRLAKYSESELLKKMKKKETWEEITVFPLLQAAVLGERISL